MELLVQLLVFFQHDTLHCCRCSITRCHISFTSCKAGMLSSFPEHKGPDPASKDDCSAPQPRLPLELLEGHRHCSALLWDELNHALGPWGRHGQGRSPPHILTLLLGVREGIRAGWAALWRLCRCWGGQTCSKVCSKAGGYAAFLRLRAPHSCRLLQPQGRQGSDPSRTCVFAPRTCWVPLTSSPEVLSNREHGVSELACRRVLRCCPRSQRKANPQRAKARYKSSSALSGCGKRRCRTSRSECAQRRGAASGPAPRAAQPGSCAHRGPAPIPASPSGSAPTSTSPSEVEWTGAC